MRDISADNQAALQEFDVYPILFLRLEFQGGTVGFNSDLQNITLDGLLYIGVGSLAQVSDVTENSDGSSNGITCRLNGLNPSILNAALNENIRNRRAVMFMGLYDKTTYQIISDPFVIFSGRMSHFTGNFGEDSALELMIEDEFADWQQPPVLRYNDATQKAQFPDDRGFEFQFNSVADTMIWGA